jgi:hypothetical protein
MPIRIRPNMNISMNFMNISICSPNYLNHDTFATDEKRKTGITISSFSNMCKTLGWIRMWIGSSVLMPIRNRIRILIGIKMESWNQHKKMPIYATLFLYWFWSRTFHVSFAPTFRSQIRIRSQFQFRSQIRIQIQIRNQIQIRIRSQIQIRIRSQIQIRIWSQIQIRIRSQIQIRIPKEGNC